MKMIALAFRNFKSSAQSYLSLVISLSFTIAVYFNFQNMIYSNTFASLGSHNKEFIDILIQTVSVVLLLFFLLFYLVCDKCISCKTKERVWHLYFYGIDKSENWTALYDGNNVHRYDVIAAWLDVRCDAYVVVSDDCNSDLRYCN